MLKLHYVEGKNILSIGNNVTRFQLDDIHSTLIKGQNGAGKTTVLEMICYALFGKTLRDVKLSQLVNSINMKKMLVTIEFTVNGVLYKVERGQKPAKFIIHVDGVPQNELGSAREQQTFIENVIGCGFKTFIQSTVIASTGYQNFMEIPAQQRRDMVEKMLDLEIIGYMVEELKEEKKVHEKWVCSIDLSHGKTIREIEHQKEIIESLKDNSTDIVKDLDISIEKCDKLFNEAKIRYEEHKKNKPDIDIDSLGKKYKELEELSKNLSSEMDSIKYKNSSLVDEYNRNKKVVDYYTNNDQCYSCHQKIDKEFAKEKCESAEKEMENSSRLGKELNKNLYDFNSNFESINLEMAEIKRQVAVLRQWQNISSELMSEGQRFLESKEQYTNQKVSLLNKGVEDASKYCENIKLLSEKLEEIAVQRAEALETQETLDIASQVLKDSGLKAKIVKKYIPVINELINHYLMLMGANYSFTLDETFNETILSRYRDNFTYKSFSNGERQRINLSIVFAWRHLASLKNTVSSSFLFIDEVLDGSLDKEGIDGVMSIFDHMKDSNLYVISHRKDIVELFDRVYTAKKNGNFSYYEEE